MRAWIHRYGLGMQAFFLLCMFVSVWMGQVGMVSNDSLWGWYLWGSLWLLGATFLLWFHLKQRQRLQLVRELAEQIQMRPQLNQIHVNTNDEISLLLKSVQQLGNRISEGEELRSQLVADVAHELRTPLTIIRGQLESLVNQEKVDSVQLFPIIDETIRMSRLIQDLQQLSLAESRKIQLQRKWISFEDWLQEMIEVLAIEAEEKQIQLSIKHLIQGEVYWDPLRMKQVLINILGNSLQYTPDGGRVEIEAEINYDMVQMVITDSGPGIPHEKLPYIFKRFYRVDGSRNRLSGGTGIGLAIAKEFVEIHQGWIDIESELGKGCVITIQVPVFPEEEKSTPFFDSER
ncbi:sensor histidine kinase [Hazenella coriacea]|uniref:histidine kinase n=1 Tax=Hazenella coriacea TaxID=1179467 RepID=A0A4R3L2Z6_9BACL|nr:HAMP domain-containing sensor histidine kinase [Hazenella coriacea]TCS92823.1 phospho-acceptor domain-containing protein [Hazenella coriacea]